MTADPVADTFDVVVIGSGPGGYVAAIRAGQLGFKTACIEKYPTVGGTCLNVGCIPSKALLDSSEHFAFASRHAAAHGIVVKPSLDLATMMKRKDQVVRDLTRGVETLFRKHKVERVLGTGCLREPGVVEVTGGAERRVLKAAHVIVATGSKAAALPGLPFDGRRIVHSTDALTLPEVPRRLLVVGAGAIGLELGSVWRRLGSEVTVIEYMDRITPGMDGPSAATLQRALERQGLTFALGASASAARVDGDGVRVTVTRGGETTEQEADVVLVAVGRRPYTEGLGAEALGLARDTRGRITVDAHWRTNLPNVYAIGDVIAGPMLAHKAEDEGIAAVERIAGQPGHVNMEAIPSVVYTWPEFAGVGLTREEAAARNIPLSVGTFPFLANGRAKAMGEREGQVTVLAHAQTDRLLGAHIVGPRASDLIAELTLAIELGASAEDVARTTHAHPTLPEAVREAALAVAKRPIHI